MRQRNAVANTSETRCEHKGADVHPDRSGGVETTLHEREWLLRRQTHEMERMTNEMPIEVPAKEKKSATKKSTAGAKAPARRLANAAKAKSSDTPLTKPANGRSRVVVEGITPQIDGGRFAVKR